MTSIELMNEMEQLPFAVRVGLANSFRAFLRNVSSEPPVKELLTMAKSREVAVQLFRRVVELSKLRLDFRYLHRFDIALATYLWILVRTYPEFATAAAEATAYLPRTWWTEQVSRYILENFSSKSDAPTNVLVELSSGNLSVANSSNVAASTSRFVPDPLFGFGPSSGSVKVTSTATNTSVLRNSNLGENEALRFDIVQSELAEPAKQQ